MSAKRLGYALIAFGVVVALVAALADPLGIGGNEGIGWKQGFLLSLGVSVGLGGLGVIRGWFAGLRKRGGPQRGEPPRRGAGAHRSSAPPTGTTPHGIDEEA